MSIKKEGAICGNLSKLLGQREIGSRHPRSLGVLDQYQELLFKLGKLYNLKRLKASAETQFPQDAAVFSLDYWKNRNDIVLSSHADGNVRLHDCRTRKVVQTTSYHLDGVNGTTVVDSNTFASFSDDQKVLVWDIRNSNLPVKECIGHFYWVKNVHLMHESKTLITTSFDQTVRTFDLNSPEPQLTSNPVLYFAGICRSQLHPTKDILYLTTWKGAVYSINNLRLDTLERDALQYFLTCNGDISSQKYIPPFSSQRNQLAIGHYVPTNGFTGGHSFSIQPQGAGCAIRYSNCEEGSYSNSPKEYVSVYDLKPWNKLRRPSGETDTTPINNWIRESNWDALNNLNRYDFWRGLKSSEEVESYLIRQTDITKQRISMLFNDFVEDLEESPTLLALPPEVRRSRFYHGCNSYCPGIIKDHSFSPCGKLLLNPILNGLEILAFDENLESFDCNHKGVRVPPKLLSVISKINVDQEECISCSFSNDGLTAVCGTMGGKIVWLDID